MEKTLKWGFPVLIALLGAFLFSACQFDSPSEPDLITYDVTTDGSSTSTSTTLNFAFSGAVEGLSANAITVGPTTVATKGNLSGSGQNWSLGITVQSQEILKVSINKSGIDSAEKTVQVYYRPRIPPRSPHRLRTRRRAQLGQVRGRVEHRHGRRYYPLHHRQQRSYRK